MATAAVPDTLPLVLRPSRKGTIAAFGGGLLFLVVGLAFAAAGSVVGAVFLLVLAAIGLVAGVLGVLPHRSELRLDDQGLQVVSPVKTWRAGWTEIDRFETAEVPIGRRSSVTVVRVAYRDGFDAQHEAASTLGKALGVDEHYVEPAYGNLDAAALCPLLGAFLARFGH